MAMNTIGVMGGSFAKGTLNTTTVYIVKMKFGPIPATVWVRPTAGTATVSYSIDEGVNYTTVTSLNGVAVYSEAQLTGPVTHLKFTGDASAAGTWGVC
jgi:hypothetical protein